MAVIDEIFQDTKSEKPILDQIFMEEKKPSSMGKLAWSAIAPYVGMAEGGAQAITSMAAMPIAGLAGLAKTITSGSEAGTKTIEGVANALTYKPQTEMGEATGELIGKGFETFLEKPSEIVGQTVADITGRPLAGAAAKTATMMAVPLAFRRGTVKAAQPKPANFEFSPEDIAIGKERIAEWEAPEIAAKAAAYREKFVTPLKVLKEERVPTETGELPQSRVTYKGYKGTLPSEAPPEGLNRGEQITVQGGGSTFEQPKAFERIPTPKKKAIIDEIFTETKPEEPSVPVEPTPTPAPEAKQPWEMTKDEFDKHWVENSKAELAKEVQGKVEGLQQEQSRLQSEINTNPENPANVRTQESISQLDKEIELQQKRLQSDIKPPSEWMTEEQYKWHKGEPPQSKQGEGATTLHANPLQAIGEAYTKNIGKPTAEWIAKHIPERLREFFKPMSTLEGGQEYLTVRGDVKGWARRTNDFMEKVGKQFDGYTADDLNLIGRVVEGFEPITSLPQEAQALVNRFKHSSKLVGEMLVKRGMLDEGQLNENYMHNMYLKYVLKDDYNPASGFKIDTGIMKSRKDMTEAERQSLGKVDIKTAGPIGLGKGLKNAGIWDAFDKIANDPRWTWTPPQVTDALGKTWDIGKLSKELAIQKEIFKRMPDNPEVQTRLATLEDAMTQAQQVSGNVPKGYVQFPDTASYGPLAGRYVKRQIANDILPIRTRASDTTGLGRTWNATADIAEGAMTAFKVGKTAFNIPTAARNVISNFIQINMSGTPFYEILPRYGIALKEMKSNTPEYITAKRGGLFETNFALEEINKMLDFIKKQEGQGRFNIIKMGKELAKYYGKIDDLAKFTKYLEQRGNGMDVNTSLLEAQKWGMDYSLASRSVKLARRSIMPFATYQYKIAPLVAESLIERPWVITKYAAVPYIMAEVAKQSLNLTEQDWDKLRRQLPIFIKQNDSVAVLPWKSPEGHPQWVNIEYFLPWQQFAAIGRDVKQGHFGEIVSDVGIGNPLLDVYTIAKTTKGEKPPKDPFNGKDVYNQLDSPTMKALKMSEWLWNKWAPGMLTREGAAGYTYRGISGEKDRYGRTVNAPQAVGRWFGGNIIAPTPEQIIKERKVIASELRTSLLSIVRDQNLSESRKQAARIEYEKRLRELNAR